MTADELERYLHREIPLSAAIGVRVEALGPGGVVLGAPLGPNVNHRRTAFAGSISALGMLAAWATVQLRLRGDGYDAEVVIQRCSLEYHAPATGDLRATCETPGADEWARLRAAIERRGRGRIEATTRIEAAGTLVVTLTGQLAAIRG